MRNFALLQGSPPFLVLRQDKFVGINDMVAKSECMGIHNALWKNSLSLGLRQTVR